MVVSLANKTGEIALAAKKGAGRRSRNEATTNATHQQQQQQQQQPKYTQHQTQATNKQQTTKWSVANGVGSSAGWFQYVEDSLLVSGAFLHAFLACFLFCLLPCFLASFLPSFRPSFLVPSFTRSFIPGLRLRQVRFRKRYRGECDSNPTEPRQIFHHSRLRRLGIHVQCW
jgi:hypothetical protein